MDVEARRLEREEKRRQRRERIRRILEDDDTPSRRTRDERGAESPRTQRSSGTTTTTRLRDPVVSTSSPRTHSRREQDQTPESKTTESSARTRRKLEESSNTSTDAKTDGSTSLDSIKARREARRRRNQEHDLRQNKLTLENGKVDKDQEHSSKGHSRIKEDGEESKGTHVGRRRRDRTDESPHKESKESTRERVSEQTVEVTHSQEVEVETTGNQLNTDTDVNDLSKKFADTKLDETVEQVGPGETCDTKLDSRRTIQTKDNTDILSEVAVDILPEISDLPVSVQEDEAPKVVNSKDGEKKGEKVRKVDEVEGDEGLSEKGVEKKKNIKLDLKEDDKKEHEVEDHVEMSEVCDEDRRKQVSEELKKDRHGDFEKLDKENRGGRMPSNDQPVDGNDFKKRTKAGDISQVDGNEKKGVDETTENDTKLESEGKDQIVSSGIESVATKEERLVTDSDLGKDNETLEDRLLEVNAKTVEQHEESVTQKELTSSEALRTDDTSDTISKNTSQESPEQDSSGNQDGGKTTEELSTNIPIEEGSDIIQDNKNQDFVETESTSENRDVGAPEKAASEASGVTQEMKVSSEKVDKLSQDSVVETDRSSKDSEDVVDGSPKEAVSNGVTEGPRKPATKKETPSKAGNLKVDDDSWKKNVRKKKVIIDKDRDVELRVLGRTGKIKDKLKTCETRDTENDPWKKEVKKTPRKQKSMDEETEKELKELSRKKEIKDRVKSCEEKDKESAEAWKREVKKTVRKHKSLDEDTESELKELSKTSALKSRIKECEEMDKESAAAFKKEVRKDARKHKSLDEETEKELRELSKVSPLKSLVKECEEKDRESAQAWKTEVKKGDLPKVADVAESSEELKEFVGRGRLKNLIASCSERDEKRDESWKTAKEQKKVKSAEEEDELKELSNLRDLKSKIIQSCEERDKESAESSARRAKSGERAKSFDETTDEEIKELSKTVDVKNRIQSQIQEQEKKAESKLKGLEPAEEEELKEINLRSRLEVYKQESEKLGTEVKKRDNAETAGFLPIKEDSRTTRSPEDEDLSSGDLGLAEKSANEQRDTTSQTRGNKGTAETKRGTKGRRSPTKDGGRLTPIKRDATGRDSPNKDSTHRGRTSPTKRDTTGKVSSPKDISHRGRTSPTKRDTAGRDSPTRNDTHLGKTSATKRDTKGRSSPTKDNIQTKSKLESIRANLHDGGKNKTKNKRESLERISKNVSIKDRIAACKERDKMSPRRLPVEKTTPKPKAKAVSDQNSLNTGNASPAVTKAADMTPVNHMGDQFMTIEEETKDASIKDALSFWQKPGVDTKSPAEPAVPEAEEDEVVDVDIKGKMSYWESPKGGGTETTSEERATKESEKPAIVVLGNAKQGWVKKNRKLNAGEFIKELLNAKCRRRQLKDIHDVKSDTKKYLELKKGEEKVRGSSESADEDLGEPGRLDKTVQAENKKNSKLPADESTTEKIPEDFSFDDVVNPDEVKQLRDFSNFRRQVRPANRRAAKSNPVRKLQQRDDLKTETDFFNDVPDEEDAPKPTAFGRLGRPIEPGDRKSKENNTFSKDALAGLSAIEDVSKITLKKTTKSRSGVSQEKSEHDGTAPVMLIQIKGHRRLQTRLVEPSVESLNSGDAFVLVTEKHLHVWLGKDSNVMKKSKASELSNKILQYKLLNCSANVVTIIKDGDVNIETALTRTFWKMLGGKPKAVKGAKQVPSDGDYEKAVVSTNVVYSVDVSSEPAKLEKLSELCGKVPSIKMLDSDKAFVFDFGTEIYAWLGRTCDKTTRTKAVDLAQEVFKGTFKVESSLNPISPNTPSDGKSKQRDLKRPSWAVFGRMTERAETILFEQKFLDWPDPALKKQLDKQKDLLNKNLSSGYAKRRAKLAPVEVQTIELVPYDGAKMAEEPPPVKMILEGVNVGRGRGSYDEIERRSLEVTTNSVTVYHSSDKECRQLEEKEWGHFYSAESYVIRWSYCVKASGIRSLKGGESKRETTGRDQIAYFFWHGRDCSASGKGTSALATIELDSDKSPQIMVDEGNESACFLNMFDGQMVVHHGKLNEAKSIEDDNVLMYCVHHEDEREISMTQIEARSSNLRSRSSFVIVVVGKSIGVCVWHGAKSTKEKKEGALRGAKRLAVWFQGLFDISKLDIVELEEGNEGNMFWESLDGKTDYGSLIQCDRKCDYRVRLFSFTSTEGPFIAKEILDPTRGELVSPHPFRQSELYSASQPALFLVDAVHEMYLWQGWWPVNPEESDSAATTGSAEFRWHRDRRLTMQTIQSYADVVGRQMSKSYVVNAGLEPVEFRALFPFWEDNPDVTRLNLESGKVDGEKASLLDLLAKLSRDRYTLAELQVRPLPEGVDPSKMEIYLSDEEFKEVFKMTKDDFNKLPKWKKLEQRKNAGLF